MNRKEWQRAVGDTTHAATDKGKEYLAQAQEALQQAQEYLAPRAQEALHEAQEALHEAQGRITPIAQDVKQKSARLAADTLDTLQPRIEEALEKVSPAVEDVYERIAPALEHAREAVTRDLLPRVNTALHEAAEHPAAVEAQQRLSAATAALSGDLRLPEKKKSAGVLATIGKVAVIGALLTGIVVALRKFLAPQESGWQAHQPSTPYVPQPTANLAEEFAAKAQGAADAVAEKAAEAEEAAAEVAEDISDAAADVAEDISDVAEDVADEVSEVAEDVADEVREGDAAPFAASPYGAGSYVGSEPPEGYSIKGNERSMKYHVQGNGGYERTIADVWFSSEEAAEAAGFKKAQR